MKTINKAIFSLKQFSLNSDSLKETLRLNPEIGELPTSLAKEYLMHKDESLTKSNLTAGYSSKEKNHE
jgi:hypothetical protein